MKAPYSRTLFDLLDEQAERYPESYAAIHDSRYVTYAELAHRSRKVATALQSSGVARGDRVAVLNSNNIEWLEICFGICALGAVAVPISTWSKASELDFLIADSEAVLLLTLDCFGDQDFASDLVQLIPELAQGNSKEAFASARYPKLRGVVMLGDSPVPRAEPYESWVSVAPIETLPPPGARGRAVDDAIILYTSGSSSRPKAVRLMHYGVIENGFNIGERQGLKQSDRVLLSAPLFWAYGAINALPAVLTHGATLVLQTKFDAGEALELIEQHRCTALYTLPIMTSALVEHPSFSSERTQSLRTGLTIGGPQDVINAAKVLGAPQMCNVYGASETFGNCCVSCHSWPLEDRANSQGEPLPGVTLRIVDLETGAPVELGQQGLVEVSGYLMAGYSGASASLNANAFTSDGFFRTGDIGLVTESGRFVFIGRSTEMIKRAGINVSPAEIEEVLLRHPKVAQAAVVGVPHAKKGEGIVAYVVAKLDVILTYEDLDAHCRAVLSNYKVPDHFEIQNSLPVTPTGKVLRRELREEALTLNL